MIEKPLLAVVTLWSCCTALAQTGVTPSSTTQVVLLGTGTPAPDPDRSGAATAIVVNGTPYLVDFGPGVVRRIAAAAQRGVRGLAPGNVQVAFLTHMHSDHTAGYPDLIFTPWAVSRTHALEVYGPRGLERMTRHVLKAYADDIRIRTRDKLSRGAVADAAGFAANAHEIRPGVVYEDANITVRAFFVNHGDVTGALGYRFDTPDRTIVISGDTAPSQAVIDHCNGCDVLIHEAYSMLTTERVAEPFRDYRRRHHTSSLELAELATRARPKLLVLYHRANPGGAGQPNPEEAVIDELRTRYDGPVVTGHDLDVF